MDAFSTLLLALLVIPLTSIFSGYTLSVLWGWFVVPLGVMALTIPQSLGIALTVGYITHQRNKIEEDAGFWNALAVGVCKSLLFLGLGWIYHIFM